ncbi:transcriptional regulator [Rhizocola hellebori]|uniref:Transcriptional regulator n=2 Tax=Rhizocola hellebori TaxID=1392758 RepID=A0A8J3QEB1_9ACTN|nr:transcriptional regulator [Rhizocola hellebori]
MQLGARIRDLRVERGLTQRELAEPGYSRGFLAAVESGHRVPTDEALAYLADRLGVGTDDLRYGRPIGVREELVERLAQVRRRLSAGDDGFAASEAARVLAEAQRYHLPDLAGLARLVEGDVLLHRNDPAAALAAFRAAAAEPITGVVAAETIARVSNSLFLTGQTAAAIELVESELRAVRAAPPIDPAVELRLLTPLIYPYVEVGAVQRARRLVDDGLALLPRVTDMSIVASFHTVASQVWNAQGVLAEVDAALNTARRIWAELGMEREIGRCHWMRGYVLLRMDRLAEADGELVLARDILGRVGAQHFYGGATMELAEVRRRQGRFDEAESLCLEAAQVVNAAGYDEGIAEADRLLGRIAVARDDLRGAEALLSRAADRYEAAGLFNELMRTCRELGELLVGQERLTEAVSVMRRGVSCVDKID